MLLELCEGYELRADLKAALWDVANGNELPLKSLASTHELLSNSRWHGISLAELIWRELAPYNAGNTEISGPCITLKPEAAQATAMVLHELATNID
jgi:two-component sensor histidine kinase